MVQVVRASQVADQSAPLSTTPAPAQSVSVPSGDIPLAVQQAIPPDAVGRPQRYSVEMAQLICDRIAEGEGLAAVCRDRALPSRRSVRDWLDRDENFAAMFARARELQADHFAEEVITISDDAEDRSTEGIQAARLQIDARKWVASKLRPRVYGDRTSVEHSGSIALEALVVASLGAAPPKRQAIEGDYVEKG